MDFSAELMQQNIAVVHQRWPQVLEQLPEPDTITELDFELVGDTPNPMLRVNGVQIASAYDPEAEARLQASEVPKHEAEVWLYGLGVGFLERELLKRNSLKMLHVVILNRSLFTMLLALFDHRSWLSDKRVSLYLPVLADSAHAPFALEPACLQLADDYASRVRDQLESHMNVRMVNERWESESDETQERLRVNEFYVSKRDGDVAELFGRWVGTTGAVVAAGPTLADGFDELRKLKSQGAPIIAVDAAVGALMTAGIRPDVVVAIDKSWAIVKSLRDWADDLKETPLVYLPVVLPEVLWRWKGPRLTAYQNHEMYRELYEKYPRGILDIAGTVMHAAVDLAVRGGCGEVRLFGVDLAFPGNQHYAPNSGHEYLAEMVSGGAAAGQRWVVDGYGERVESVSNFVMYLRALEKYIESHPEVRFVNMSRKGAYIHGAHYLDEDS